MDGGKEFGEVEALDCHCIQVTPSLDYKGKIIVNFVDPGDKVLKCWVRDRGWRRFGGSCQFCSRLGLRGLGACFGHGLGCGRLGWGFWP